MKLFKICFVFLLIILSGCAGFTNIGKSRFNIAVDSLAAPDATSKKTYLLLPGNSGTTPADLQYQEFAAYLNRILKQKGYEYTESKEDADLVVYLSYGIGDPETHQYTYSLPVWGRTGTYASTHVVATTDANGEKAYTGYTTYVPSYGFIGYRSYVDSVTAYYRFAVIAAYDYDQFKKDEKEIQLWKTTVTSMGTSDDLRRIFPLLMAASVPYLATDTGHKVYLKIFEDDDSVKEIKGDAKD